MSWTPERIDELTKLWETGHSASAIGKILGVSKNAVVGKAHRMKLQARPSPIKRGEDGGAANSASGAKPAAKKSQNGAKSAPTGDRIAAGSKPDPRSEPVQTVISAALAAKSANPGSGRAASSAAPVSAAMRSAKQTNGTHVAAQAKTTAKAARNGTRDTLSPAARAVQASRRGPKCLWPIGDPGDDDFHFCGEPAQSGKPYCSEHCARAYITRSRSDSAAA
ncbi:GcrA family cell cycle regulator [Pelagibius sp. Alg239-R121]|uniref:GcrA family cell cycle regulator n=1 Tax=Pelagibius sp. Alg239-R121 TaxID=2993448 RepID=UPI0024A79C59|nr:GcrA family cell cycle regulator [Pelagibius sp. Alg239-R121]